MKKNKIILFLFAIPLFFSTGFLKKTNTVEDKWKRNIGADFIGISDLSEYEVRFTYTGYRSFYGGPPECLVNPNGKVVLTGLLKGVENVNPDDDIVYSGVLQLDINMDICSAKRLSNGEDKLCDRKCDPVLVPVFPVLFRIPLELYLCHRRKLA